MSENKEIKSLNDLPDDVLLEIFAYLEKSSILVAMDVCKRWDVLITANTNLHPSFTLDLKFGDQGNKSNRLNKFKFQKLEAFRIDNECETDSEKQQKEVFQRNKENIKEARICRCTWSFVEKDLMEMTNLVKLSLGKITFDQIPSELTLLNLKQLEIMHEPNFLYTPNLVKLEFHGDRFPNEFIDKCMKLTHLTLRMISRNDELSAISPHLSFLKLSIDTDTLILPLLESQKDSLKELEMNHNNHGEVGFAINNMKLEKLNIWIPNNLTLSKSKNTSIKELKLKHFDYVFPQAIVKILRTCSFTEKLILEQYSIHNQATAMIASAFLTNLKHLAISEGQMIMEFPIANPVEDFIKTFDSMESILITLYDNTNMDLHLRLLSNCSTLKKLEIKWNFNCCGLQDVEPIASNDLQRILDCVPDLEVLITEKAVMLSKDVIEILQKSKIRILKIIVKSEDDVFEEQQKLAIKLSKQSDIRCTVFSFMKLYERVIDEFFGILRALENDDRLMQKNFWNW